MDRTNLINIARESRESRDSRDSRERRSPSYADGISDYEVAILRIKTGHPAIAIRRAVMKVGSNLKKIESELIAQKMDRS
jgi:hypothetical protein